MNQTKSKSLQTSSGKNGVAASGAVVVNEGQLLKKSAFGYAGKKLKEQAIWMQSLPRELGEAFPLIHSIEWTPSQTTILMNDEGLRSADQVILANHAAEIDFSDQFLSAMSWIQNSLHIRQTSGDFFSVQDMIFMAEKRLLSIPAEFCNHLNYLITKDEIVISGRPNRGLLALLEDILGLVNKLSVDVTGCMVHGDLHTGNVLVGKSRFKLIDPRGGFPGNVQLASKFYDYGKVMHDIVCGYSLIKNSHISSELDYSNYELKLNSPTPIRSFQLFRQTIVNELTKRFHLKPEEVKLSIICGGLAIASAIPFHLRFHERSLTMALSAIIVLNAILVDTQANTDFRETCSCVF